LKVREIKINERHCTQKIIETNALLPCKRLFTVIAGGAKEWRMFGVHEWAIAGRCPAKITPQTKSQGCV
jgi:hypothetical protein